MNRYGFIPHLIEEQAYIFGLENQSAKKVVRRSDRDWRPFCPEQEKQYYNGWDSYGCSVFGTYNMIEIYMKCVYGKTINYAERFTYNIVPIRPYGGDPHDVMEAIRKNGLVEQDVLPLPETFDEFKTPFPMSQELLDHGKRWLSVYEFEHDYLWNAQPSEERKEQLIHDALVYSPVGVSVTAWHRTSNGLYHDAGLRNNHWCVLVYAARVNGKYVRVVYDTYDGVFKELDPTHRIRYAKKIYIAKVYNGPRKPTLLELIKRFFSR
jgi:hypothetical protein